MKYLENEKLNELTAELSDAVLGQSHRVINGRIEAYTMKRAGNDKKFAHALGQKYIAEIEELQQEIAETVERRKRSSSAASFSEVSAAKRPKPVRLRSLSYPDQEVSTSHPARPRSQSYDFALDSFNSKTTLGDFSVLSTRRLMTDLILTLNASFPDYDFSNVKPNQFENLKLEAVRKRICERLSELASFKAQKDWLVELWLAVNDVIDLRECDVYSLEEDIEEDALWSFHYFFVNKSLRRIVFFTCSEKIDDERREEIAEEKISFYNSEAQMVDDFDWDPSDDVAGGLSLPIPTV